MITSTFLQESIATTIINIPPPKVSWVDSPFLELRDKGKKAVGNFGEYIVRDISRSNGWYAERLIKKGHDVICTNNFVIKKIEVKTACQGKNGSFWFNQIYYESTDKGEKKDWDYLCFVFIKPKGIEVWECKKPNKPEIHFRMNNGWMWQKPSSNKLDKKTWNQIYKEDFTYG